MPLAGECVNLVCDPLHGWLDLAIHPKAERRLRELLEEDVGDPAEAFLWVPDLLL